MRLRNFSLIASIVCLLSARPVHAFENITHLPKAEEVEDITLILTSPGLRTRTSVTESYLKKNGCTFTSRSNSEKNSEMINILSLNLKELPEAAGQVLLRNTIYLKLKTGKLVSITLSGADHPNQDIYGGIALEESSSYKPLLGSKVLLKSLREWASANVSRSNFSKNCLKLN